MLRELKELTIRYFTPVAWIWCILLAQFGPQRFQERASRRAVAFYRRLTR